jgi:SAM-dependent methyltransferase
MARFIPEWIKTPVRPARDFLFSLFFRNKGHWCPVCEKTSPKFAPYGNPPREGAECPYCGSLERHRLVWQYFSKMTNLFDGTSKKMLHVAPERCIEKKLRNRLGEGYITADLFNPRAMVKMDITDIQYPDGYFDVIYCSHVLEHVVEDKKAIGEFYRVLKQEGWAILVVPINADRTIEDPSITDPAERLRVFGQAEHVRRYGPDFVDRLRQAQFKVRVSRVSDLFKPEEIERMRLPPANREIYYCTKA